MSFTIKKMKQFIFILGLLFTCGLHTQAKASEHILSLDSLSSSPKAKLADVAWIAGNWKGEAFGGIVEENWSEPTGDSMMAAFKLIKNGKVSFYELEIIREVKESLTLQLKHFNGDLKGWETKDETIDFPLVKITDNAAYFGGITFEKISAKEMNIYVLLGQKDGTKKEVKINYIK